MYNVSMYVRFSREDVVASVSIKERDCATLRRMRLVQLPVTKVVVLLTLLVPCLSVTFEDGSSGSEARGESFEIR